MSSEVAELSTAITEPFCAGRSPARLLFDFSVMLACLKPDFMDERFLDFGAGSCWISEFIARMGKKVVAFDIHDNLNGCVTSRLAADKRINPSLVSFKRGDGHCMPFLSESFGHILCYDTLHHMYDYDKVFREFRRVLRPGGRAIFVEPGANHSKSAETIAFLKTMQHDPTWIERDVKLDEINAIAKASGFNELTIVPTALPSDLIVFAFSDWQKYRSGNKVIRDTVSERLSSVNYNERVIFYCDRS